MNNSIPDEIANHLGGFDQLSQALDIDFFWRGEDGLSIRLEDKTQDKINHIEIADMSPEGYQVKFYEWGITVDPYSPFGFFMEPIRVLSSHRGLSAAGLLELINRQFNLQLQAVPDDHAAP